MLGRRPTHIMAKLVDEEPDLFLRWFVIILCVVVALWVTARVLGIDQ